MLHYLCSALDLEIELTEFVNPAEKLLLSQQWFKRPFGIGSQFGEMLPDCVDYLTLLQLK